MKILIVDDEYDKVEQISSVIASAGLTDYFISHETTASSARLALRTAAFDLLLIDLNLPELVGASRSQEGGLAFFDIIGMDQSACLPPDVLFITGREDLFETAREKVLERGGLLCQYGADLDQWKVTLLGRLKYASRRLSRLPGFTEPVDIAIVTALRHPELDAVLRLPYGWQSRRLGDDAAQYHFGKVDGAAGPLNVVAASSLRKGMPSSAALATKMSMMFRPRYLVMLGICAGIRGKTSLGDIVVADPTWDWGSGKRSQDNDGSPVFLAAPHQRPLDTQVAHIVNELADDPDTARTIRANWPNATPAGTLSVKVGPMASGASVIADAASANSIIGQNRELLAIEMEAYAVMAAAEYCGTRGPVAIAIKSVCDFADPEKVDDWQAYASFTSASFADILFRHPSFARSLGALSDSYSLASPK